MQIRLLDEAGAREASEFLGELLVDAVQGGASVGFLPGLQVAEAAAWWRDTVAPRVGSGAGVLFVAEVGGKIVGTVQLVLPGFPNGRRRAEVAKLLVHSTQRRRGIARVLLARAEEAARQDGRVLLILDTETGSAAEKLYAEVGWVVAGVIPDFALDTEGRLHSTTFMYRRLG